MTPDHSTARKALAAVLVAMVLIAGVLLLGRIAPDDTSAIASGAGWLLLVAAGTYLVTRRSRDLRVPLAIAVAGSALAVSAPVAYIMLVDDEVNERVVVGTPASEASMRRSTRNIELVAGSFEPLAHDARGRAAIVELPGGERRLTLTSFHVDNGPDLFVYLVAGNPRDDGDVDDYKSLGHLKGNTGNQQYEVPPTVDLQRYSTVVIWCRAFTVAFAKAPLLHS